MSSSASSKGKGKGKGKVFADVVLDSHSPQQQQQQQQDDAGWEVISRKPYKNKQPGPGPGPVKQWPPNTCNSKPQRTHIPSSHHPIADPIANPRPRPPNTRIAPPLDNGWKWQSRPTHSQLPNPKPDNNLHNDDDDDDDSNAILDDDDDDDDDELLSDDDDFDSDSSAKSHNTLKQSKWFSKFFRGIEELEMEEVNNPEREWHCPACQGGPGAVEWFQGLQPLMTHAKTKGGDRMKLHRTLAQLLEQELKSKGTSVIPPGEAFGRWKLLQDQDKDHQIVWPPMVVIMNTQLEKDDNDKWLGMGNQELVELFSFYKPAKARHSYGPQGHRGMSVLIFEGSARGYVDAERLHKNFVDKGTDRNAWMSHRLLFHHGGNRLLHGYLATKQDLDFFNQHSQGKSKLKFELRSHRDMVVNQIWQMSEDNQQLGWYKDKFIKEKRHSKAVEESLVKVTQKLDQKHEEMHIVRLRTKMQHEENREEMLQQEQFFKEQIKNIHESRKADEEDFERLQQEERDKMKYSTAIASNAEESQLRTVEVSQFIQHQDREMEDYAVQRETIYKEHQEKINAMKKRYWEEEVALEKKFTIDLTRLKDKYSPIQPKDTTE